MHLRVRLLRPRGRSVRRSIYQACTEIISWTNGYASGPRREPTREPTSYHTEISTCRKTGQGLCSLTFYFARSPTRPQYSAASWSLASLPRKLRAWCRPRTAGSRTRIPTRFAAALGDPGFCGGGGGQGHTTDDRGLAPIHDSAQNSTRLPSKTTHALQFVFSKSKN